MTINISKDMKTATLTDGCVLYTEDGRTFTQVDTSTGYLLSITQPGSLREAFLSAATWAPVPMAARFEYEEGAPARGAREHVRPQQLLVASAWFGVGLQMPAWIFDFHGPLHVAGAAWTLASLLGYWVTKRG